jgi:hypothetical protein
MMEEEQITGDQVQSAPYPRAEKKQIAQDQVQPTLYPRAELVARAREIFGVYPEIVIGALYGNTKSELSTDDVRAAIKDFLERKVS